MQNSIYFLNESIDYTNSGVEIASMKRTLLFENDMNQTPGFVTVKFHPFYQDVISDHILNGKLPSAIQHVNLYDYYRNKFSDGAITTEVEDKFEHYNIKEVNDTFDKRYYHQNQLVIYEKRDDKNRLQHRNYFFNKQKHMRKKYDHNGLLIQTQILRMSDGKVFQESYHTLEGKTWLMKFYDEKDDKVLFHLLEENGSIANVFFSEQNLIEHFLKEITRLDVCSIFIIDKERVFYPIIREWDRSKYKIICMIHSTHLSNSTDHLKGKINSNYQLIFDNLNLPNGIVVFTNKQRDHIIQRYGVQENLHVIPHAIEADTQNIEFGKRDPNLIISLGRFAPEKQFDHLINAMVDVIKVVPNARLELYGKGALITKYKELISQIGLEKSISIKPYETDVAAIYRKASLSVLTSKAEGFSLFVQESLSFGCPVVSYDVNYGPSDMIQNSENGYIVTCNDVKELSQKIIEVLENKELNMRMSLSAYDKIKQFSSKQISKKWQDLINKIVE